jgi:hypothetical protein
LNVPNLSWTLDFSKLHCPQHDLNNSNNASSVVPELTWTLEYFKLAMFSTWLEHWCHVLRTGHTQIYIYSFFPAVRAPSFLYNIPIYTYIIPTAPSGLDSYYRLVGTCVLSGQLGIEESFGKERFSSCDSMSIFSKLFSYYKQRKKLIRL